MNKIFNLIIISFLAINVASCSSFVTENSNNQSSTPTDTPDNTFPGGDNGGDGETPGGGGEIPGGGGETGGNSGSSQTEHDTYSAKSLNHGNNSMPEIKNKDVLHTILYALPTDKYSEASNKVSLNTSISLTNRPEISSKTTYDLFSNIDTNYNLKAYNESQLSDVEKHYIARQELENEFLNRQKDLLENGVIIGKNKKSINFKAPFVDTQKFATCDNSKTESLFIHDGSNKKITAKCIGESSNGMYYLDTTKANLSTETLNSVKKAFEDGRTILRDLYSHEADVDKNGKVVFVITSFNNRSLMGYFYSGDKYYNSSLSSKDSNEGDILYINYDYLVTGNAEDLDHIQGTFLHEFQHMLLFDHRYINTNINKPSEDSLATWINEGLSMLAEYKTGHAEPHSNYITGLFRDKQGSNVSIWLQDGSSYGLSLLFIRYINERFGDGVIKKLYNSKKTNIDAIEEATGVEFNELFKDFATMILVTGRNITTDPRYNIPAFNHKFGTAEYKKNGFNLADAIDEIYNNKINIQGQNSTSLGYIFIPTKNKPNLSSKQSSANYTIQPYSISLTKWIKDKPNDKYEWLGQNPSEVVFNTNNNNNIYGLYEIYEPKDTCEDFKTVPCYNGPYNPDWYK